MKDTVKQVLASEFKDNSGRTFREFLADSIIKLFKYPDSCCIDLAASNPGWYHTAFECLLPLDPKIGHYEDYNETEKEFVLDDYNAANTALVHVINTIFKTTR
jgi:hypothetical protein